MPDFAPPGLEPDIPVGAGLVAAAHEGVRTAITAAERLAAGARFTYAVCRPPGHHAGPDFLGGYCYLNNAAAAVQTLLEAAVKPVGILDLDLHYPNGTAALVERMDGATLHSLHASPVTNVAAGTVLPRAEGERVVAFAASPDADAYLEEVAASIEELAGDRRRAGRLARLRHRRRRPARLLELLAARSSPRSVACWPQSGRPVCVIQEGGYALPTLAACSHAFATGLLGGGRGMSAAWSRSAAASTRSTTRSPACSASASRSAAKSPSTRAPTGSR